MSRIHEEILEAIWAGEEKETVSIEQIRKLCHIQIEEEILRGMEKDDLIAYDGANVYFTGKGKEMARQLIRRKRLAEVLLETVLNIRGDRAARIVCEFEHAVIPEVEESICILLGHPTECPHGQKIPEGLCCKAGKGNIESTVDRITNLRVGEKIKIAYIKPASHKRLHKLLNFGIRPGTVVEIHQKTPAFIIRYDNSEIAMDVDVAEDIYGWRST